MKRWTPSSVPVCGDDRQLAQALSAYGVMMGLAGMTGQFLGGALVQWSPFDLGWRAVFLLKLPICLLVLGAAWRLLPETSAPSRAKLDLAGAALVSLALACVIVPLSEGRDQGWPLWVLTRPEAVAFDFAFALVNGGVLPELTYRAAVQEFGQHGAAELSYLVGLYCLVSVTLNTFDVPVPD